MASLEKARCSGINIITQNSIVERSTMSQENYDKKSAAESFGKMFESFGEAMSQIFNDPDLKEKAKEFGKSATDSAKVFGSRFKDDDVRAKFRDTGKAAQDFGKCLTDYFKESKDKNDK